MKNNKIPSKHEVNVFEKKLLTALYLLYERIEQTDYVKDMLKRIEKRLNELK